MKHEPRLNLNPPLDDFEKMGKPWLDVCAEEVKGVAGGEEREELQG